MIGILIITHSGGFAKAAVSILGKLQAIEELRVNTQEDITSLRKKINKKKEKLNKLDGIIILIDIFGGSITSLCSELLDEKTRLISGINLPMLINIIMHQDGVDIDKIVECGKVAAIKNITELKTKSGIYN